MANPVLSQLVDAAVTIQCSEAITIGDLIGINTSNQWVKADADTPSMYAQFVATADGVQADQVYEVAATKRAYFTDADFPYTQGARQYLSSSAGAHTATRPTTDGAVIQIVGKALSTNLIYIDIKTPTLVNAFVGRNILDTSSEPGLGTADVGWAAAQLTGTEAAYTDVFRVPHNCCSGALKAKLVFDSVNASVGDLDVTVVGAYDGASNVQDTGTAIEAGDWEQTDADNIMLTMDISSCLDAGLFTPGRTFCVFLDPDGITGAAQFLGMWLEFEVV